MKVGNTNSNAPTTKYTMKTYMTYSEEKEN